MTREEYAQVVKLAAALWDHIPSQATVDAWWQHLENFTRADAEDALHRLARTCDKWPSLASLRMECHVVRRNHYRQPAPVVTTAAERERAIRFGRLIAQASREGCLVAVHDAMRDAKKIHGDPLAAAEQALHYATSGVSTTT